MFDTGRLEVCLNRFNVGRRYQYRWPKTFGNVFTVRGSSAPYNPHSVKELEEHIANDLCVKVECSTCRIVNSVGGVAREFEFRIVA